MHASVVLAVLVSGLSACTWGSTDSLADAHGEARLVYRFGKVVVDFGRAPPNCVELGSDLRGTANGHPMTVVDHGHYLHEEPSNDYDGNPISGSDLCILPALDTHNRPGSQSLDIVIEDSSARIHATFDDLFTQRAITRLGPSIVGAGDLVELAWSPTTDRLPETLEFLWADRTSFPSELVVAENTIVDGHITVVAPAVAVPKPLELAVYNWSFAISLGASTCEGVAACDVELDNEGVLALTYQIEP